MQAHKIGRASRGVVQCEVAGQGQELGYNATPLLIQAAKVYPPARPPTLSRTAVAAQIARVSDASRESMLSYSATAHPAPAPKETTRASNQRANTPTKQEAAEYYGVSWRAEMLQERRKVQELNEHKRFSRQQQRRRQRELEQEQQRQQDTEAAAAREEEEAHRSAFAKAVAVRDEEKRQQDSVLKLKRAHDTRRRYVQALQDKMAQQMKAQEIFVPDSKEAQAPILCWNQTAPKAGEPDFCFATHTQALAGA